MSHSKSTEDTGLLLLESVYEAVAAYELRKRGLVVNRQQPIPLVHQEVRVGVGFRADLIVEHKVAVEIKSIEAISPVTQKAITHLSSPDRQTTGSINQFQRGIDKERDFSRCESTAGLRDPTE